MAETIGSILNGIAMGLLLVAIFRPLRTVGDVRFRAIAWGAVGLANLADIGRALVTGNWAVGGSLFPQEAFWALTAFLALVGGFYTWYYLRLANKLEQKGQDGVDEEIDQDQGEEPQDKN